MKFKFEPNLDFQLQAVEAVCDLFRGQEICRTEFTVTRSLLDQQEELAFAQTDLGIGNRLTLLDDEILKNLNAIQLRNGLPPSASLTSGDFTVEMETGTGKTYVYLRTIFELNKRFGFTKFVIVVPSIAIKEGVYKSLQMTKDHFRGLYSGVPFDYFLYDSSKLGQVRNFAASPHIQIMVVTVGAINKKNINNIYDPNEKTGGERPIDLIRATRPILIVDEPQSVDGGLRGRGRRRGKEALEAMHPLCTLRYSATHVDQHHMIYRLDAVDAYERKLVKQIEVASATVKDAHNRPYIRLISTSNKHGDISATVELDIETAGRVRRDTKIVRDGDDLEQTTDRTVYRNCRIGEIRVGKGNAFMELRVPGDERFLQEGEAWGDVDADAVQHKMICRVIHEHLDKEKRLHPLGIKVLSLFFIDKVGYYRSYDEAGNANKGKYALMFEEEYRRLTQHPDYHSFFQTTGLPMDAKTVHDGYFSIDKKGGWIDTAENNQANRDNAERAYNLIMKEKEKLLSMDEPLRFIFSHSALREGWDNPNVFQICALRDIQTERERRQTIGRGLRLCVDQGGERLRGFDVNTLTVIARESYEEFAENLQREIEADTGIRFGVIQPHQFAQIPVIGNDNETVALGFDKSQVLYDHLRAQGYIDTNGGVQDSLRQAIRDDSFAAPEEFTEHRAAIVSILRKHAGRLEIRNAAERQTIRPRQAMLDSAEFKALWDRIKHKTTYRVAFNNDALLSKCTTELQAVPAIPRTRLQWRKANLFIGQSGISATESKKSNVTQTIILENDDIELPDLLTELQDRTQLTRRSISIILVKSGRLNEFKKNPQKFIELAAATINHCKKEALVDGIKYQRIGNESYYAQELFAQEELTGYLRNMIPKGKSVYEKSVYEKVIYESDIEKQFADQLEQNTAIKIYAKLPGWFKVPTPLGSYNPDWAVLVESDTGERLYFVVETKGSMHPGDLRSTERAKIEYGKAHFKALAVREEPARYRVATSVDDLLGSGGD